jgi:predicted metal-dependent hydrolase
LICFLGMKKTLELNQRTVEYTHRTNRRSKRIRLAIYPGGEIIVTTPPRITEGLIDQFIQRKSKWILSKLDYLIKFPVQSAAVSAKEYKEYKAKALDIVKERLAYFNSFYGFKYGRVSIKNHKSLWGSCSRQGNLNFNYKIALIPQRFSDYVIVHELCHLKEFNHSKRFWDLVAQTIPDHKIARRYFICVIK